MCFKLENSDNGVTWKCSTVIIPYRKVVLLVRLVLNKLYLWGAFVHPKVAAETRRYNVNSCNLNVITVLHLDLFTFTIPHWFLGMGIVGLWLNIFFLVTIKSSLFLQSHSLSADHWLLITLMMTWPVKLALRINRTKIALRKKFILCQINNPIPFQWIHYCGALKTRFTVSFI